MLPLCGIPTYNGTYSFSKEHKGLPVGSALRPGMQDVIEACTDPRIFKHLYATVQLIPTGKYSKPLGRCAHV